MPVRRRKLAVLIGDSITQQGWGYDGARHGWASRLSEHYVRKVDFLNRGYSGFNSKWVDENLEDVLSIMEPRIDLAVVFLGANDAVFPEFPSHVGRSSYMRHLTNIISKLQQRWRTPHVLLVSPPPVAEGALTLRNKASSNPRGLDRNNQRTKLYVDAARNVAKSLNGAVFVDAWAGMSGAGSEEERGQYLRDGLHLSDRGNARLFELLVSTIETEVPGWTADAMPPDLPHWSELPREKNELERE